MDVLKTVPHPSLNRMVHIYYVTLSSILLTAIYIPWLILLIRTLNPSHTSLPSYPCSTPCHFYTILVTKHLDYPCILITLVPWYCMFELSILRVSHLMTFNTITSLASKISSYTCTLIYRRCSTFCSSKLFFLSMTLRSHNLLHGNNTYNFRSYCYLQEHTYDK